MRYFDLLVSIFTKEIGQLIEEKRSESEFGGTLAAEFLYQNRISVQIIFIKIEPETWVIHHELTREEPALLKKVAYLCERIHRIGNTKHTTILLSEDLQDVLRQNIITTAIKCSLQNLFNLFILFNAPPASSASPVGKTENGSMIMKTTRSKEVS